MSFDFQKAANISSKSKNLFSNSLLIKVYSLIITTLFIFSITINYILINRDWKEFFLLQNLINKQDYELVEIVNLIEKEGLYELPNETKIREGKLKGIVSSLDDPYSNYLNKEEIKTLEQSLNQEYVGIGIKLEEVNNKIIIDYILKNSPAEISLLKINDIITKVDGKSIEGLTLNEVSNKIRGKENTKVKLTIKRLEEKKEEEIEIEIEIERKIIQSELIYLEIKDSTAIIEINSFGNNLDQKMEEISQNIVNNSNIKNIVLDLRGNGGGLLNEVVEVISYFVDPNIEVVKEKYKNTEEVLRSKEKNTNLKNYPLIIWVDQETASASEILTLSLKELNNIYIIGQPTFGKGVVQRLFFLESGSQLKLTVAKWYSPKEKEIDKIGIKPDEKAITEEEYASKTKNYFIKKLYDK